MDAPLVKLVVKNVYTPSQTLALSVPAQTLVGELKRLLQQQFPQQPPPASQKLIFGGKICRDDEPLRLVLAQVQSSHAKDGDDGDEPMVFHLLVAARHEPKRSESPREAAEAADSPRPRTESSPSFEEPQHTPTQSTFQQTQQQTQQQQQQQQQNLYRQSVLMQQQAMVLSQIQYLQFMLMQARQGDQQPFAHQFGAHYGNFYGMMPVAQMFHAQTQGAAPQPAAVPTPAATPVPAQATPETPAEPQQRPLIVEIVREVLPLLDFRMALKMAFMLFIIGQDTPMDRILMLALLSFISYLHITGIFAKIYEVYNRRRAQPGEAEGNAAADPNAPGAAAAAGAAIAERYSMLTRVLRISSDRGFVQDVKYFVVGLLLSLVPAWHPQPLGAAPMHENAMPDGAGDVPLQGI